MNQLPNHKAFTLIEVIVVIAIIGLIVAFSLPNYKKAQEKTYESVGSKMLITLFKANRAHKAKNGTYWPTDGSTYGVDDIITNLKVDLVEDGLTYTCTGDGAGYNCDAARDGGSFTLRITKDDLDTGPCCQAGSCPSEPIC